MSEHYTRNVTETIAWCNKCERTTRHAVSAGKLAHCMEHEAQHMTQKQITQAKRRKQGELFT